jgi:homoserine kinase
MVDGLIAGNPYLVGKCMEDVIVEPARAHLIPGFYEIKYAALKEGATGCTISGSGPAIVAVAPTKQKAEKIGHAMRTVCQRTVQLESELYISKTNLKGAIRLKKGRS